MQRTTLALAAALALPLGLQALPSGARAAEGGSPVASTAQHRHELDALTRAVELYERALRTTAQNVANADSAGFKRTRARLHQGETGLELELERSFEQGELELTGRALDLAIDGPGFFQLSDEAGRAYFTRDGHFRVDSAGAVVTSEGLRLAGMPILDDEGAPEDLDVDRFGRVHAILGGTRTQLGSLPIFDFPTPEGLEAAMGQDHFRETEASGRPIGVRPSESAGAIVQGALEHSNVTFEAERLRLRHLEARLRELIALAE